MIITYLFPGLFDCYVSISRTFCFLVCLTIICSLVCLTVTLVFRALFVLWFV